MNGRAVSCLPLLVSACGFTFDLEGRCFQGEPCADAGTVADVDTNPTGDDDKDGAKNSGDICREVWNPTQLDYDEDGAGDECDACPFVASREPPCYESWELAQLDGEWEGFRVSHEGEVGLVGVPPAVTVEALSLELSGGSWANVQKPEDAKTATLTNTAVATLARLGGSAADGVLIVDSRRELMVGHTVTRSGKAEGAAAPPNLVILLRKRRYHGGVLADTPLAETRAPENRPAERTWRLHGLLDVDAVTKRRLTVQAAFRTLVSEKALEIQGHSGGNEGLAYAFEQGLHLPGQEKAKLPFATGGDLEESLARTRLIVPLQDATISALDLVGHVSFSRDVGVFRFDPNTPAGEDVRGFFLVTETTAESAKPDPRLRRWGAMGLLREASALLYVPDRPETGSVVGLQLHAESAVSGVIEAATAGYVGSDFVGFNLGTTLAAPLSTVWSSPRTCLFPTPGAGVALQVMCTSTGVTAADGCPTDVLCPLTLGLAVGLDAEHPDSDYDLDGRATIGLSTEAPCSGEGNDPCPCAINPLEDCP